MEAVGVLHPVREVFLDAPLERWAAVARSVDVGEQLLIERHFLVRRWIEPVLRAGIRPHLVCNGVFNSLGNRQEEKPDLVVGELLRVGSDSRDGLEAEAKGGGLHSTVCGVCRAGPT